MSKKDLTLTSVKIQSDLFEEFKVACVRHKFSFQKLADRCVHLYLTDEDFKRQIHNHNNLDLKVKNEKRLYSQRSTEKNYFVDV